MSWAELEEAVFEEAAEVLATRGTLNLAGFGDLTARSAVNYLGHAAPPDAGTERLLFFRPSSALIAQVTGRRRHPTRITCGELVERVAARTGAAVRDVEDALQDTYGATAARLTERRSAAPMPGLGLLSLRVRPDDVQRATAETLESWRHGDDVTFQFRAAARLRERLNGRPPPALADREWIADVVRGHPQGPVTSPDDLFDRAARLPEPQQVADRGADAILGEAGFLPPLVSTLLSLRSAGRPVLDALVDQAPLYGALDGCARAGAVPFARDADGWWAYCACAPERDDPWVFVPHASRHPGHRHRVRLGQWLAVRLLLAELATVPGALPDDALSGVLAWVDEVAPCCPDLLDGLAV
ncbi:MAG: hypothetical protein H6709_06070 [Kofleriaceae bacterium]|nr:hypothetical protein [Myxococcales bacterium]MCB9560430.1 hypothetical protein [Kofleriaceae bacterium]MCB9571640.1 hypothetical protein [Kofleriaceae bacterium]